MSLNVELKRINALSSTTSIDGTDVLIVELASGGTKKMTYNDFIDAVVASLTGLDDSFLTKDAIVSVQTDDGEKIPAASLLYAMNEELAPLIREQRCINNGEDGEVWDLDELMVHVRAGNYHKFAIGDAFVDNSVTWRIFDKRNFPKWAFDGTTGEAPHHITCLPDTALATHRYNSSNTNTGGYAASEMPAYLNDTLYPALSTNLKSYILETQIYENNKGTWAATKRKMRIPTVIECTGTNGFADHWSGGICSQLKLMRAARHRIKTYWYWCLDPSGVDTTNFCYINNTGDSYRTNASSTTGSVRPEIVLG